MLCKDDPLLEKTGGVKPYGTAPELERRADVLVYEVFDSGFDWRRCTAPRASCPLEAAHEGCQVSAYGSNCVRAAHLHAHDDDQLR